jgi:hypothetical protein
LRKTLWFVFSLFPIWSFASFYVVFFIGRSDPAQWPIWGALLSAGVPFAIVEGVQSQLWWVYVGLVVAHYAFFILHPFFNGVVSGWKRKLAWAVSNLWFYPFLPPIYALFFCMGNARTEPKSEPRRARAYSGRTLR